MHSIDQIGYHLAPGGIMILVESSATAQARLNELRKCHNLHLLEPPFHNLFFDDYEIQKHNFEHIELNKIDPFASDFYFITRLIYARYAKEHLHEKTHYEHPLEKIALSMAHHRLTSDFSQIQAYIIKKKM